MSQQNLLLSIVEIGGYPDFSALYKGRGFQVETVHGMRRAVKVLKKQCPRVVVAEFNYQSDFRDRTSSLETLMATLQRIPDTRVIVFYEKEQSVQLQRLLNVFDVFATLTFPVDEAELSGVLDRVIEEAA